MDSTDTFNRPIVGVFIKNISIRKLLKQEPKPNLLRIEKANDEAKVTLFYFSIRNVDLKRRKIFGTYYNKQKKLWEEKDFPYPDFIYKRSGYRRGYEDLFNSFERQLQEAKIQILNYPQPFNKWEVYQHLSGDKDILPYLPLTSVYYEPKDLKEMLQSNEKIYLKSFVGGRGRKIICVTKLPQGGYEYRYFLDQLYIHRVNNFNKLVRGILGFYKDKKFLMQEAIDLIKIDNSIVDMRAEVQRDKNGEIIVIAIPVRVGQIKSPITTHANAYTFEYFFKYLMEYSEADVVKLKKRIIYFLKSAYRSIENAYGPSVEIGIDLGLDKKNCLWFIECNSRSLKISLYKAYDENTINKSFLNILEYAKFRYSKGMNNLTKPRHVISQR